MMAINWQDRLSRSPVARTERTLFFADSMPQDSERRFGRGLAARLIERIYADHNRSRVVRRCLAALYRELRDGDGLGLNFGAGRSPRVDRVVNLDVYPGDHVDVVYDGEAIPFESASFDVIISQEVFEHIADAHAALDEVARVAKPGARFFLQLPFIIGFHSAPGDYWRFSSTGIRLFVESTGKFRVIESGIACGHGTGFYRILVEFLAVTASIPVALLYRPMKLVAAVLFYWVKFFDVLTPLASQRDRIAGGYFVIAERT